MFIMATTWQSPAPTDSKTEKRRKKRLGMTAFSTYSGSISEVTYMFYEVLQASHIEGESLGILSTGFCD